jgi:ABC-type transporter Mla maintaining outer membrane lipid asymmetry ATPase subunit MlaF
VVLFDKVNLAFDDKVILTDVTFSVRAGIRRFSRRQRRRKIDDLKLMLGLLKPDSGTIWVSGTASI